MSVGTAPGMLQTCCSTQTSSSTALLCVACYSVAVHTATPGCVLRTQCSGFAAVLGTDTQKYSKYRATAVVAARQTVAVIRAVTLVLR